MPVTQNMLPVVLADNRIVGGLVISSTTFSGTETTATISSQTIPLRKLQYHLTKPTVTSPKAGNFFQEYWVMAASFSNKYDREYIRNGWQLGTPFIPLKDLATSHLERRWVVAQSEPQQFETYTGLFAFLRGQTSALTSPVIVPQPGPGGSNGTLSWTCNVPFANAQNCSFFDFDAYAAFNATTTQKELLQVEVITQPNQGAQLRAYVVPSVVSAYGGNAGRLITVRILKVTEVAVVPGPYVFGFRLTDNQGQTRDVTLTVNVTA